MNNCFNMCFPAPCCRYPNCFFMPTLSIGTVTTGQPGTSADASIVQNGPNYSLNLTIPQGATGNTGPMPTLEIGTVTVGTSPTDASATLTPTATGYALNLTLPIANQ